MTRHVYSVARVLMTGVILSLCPITKAQDPRPRPTGSISGHILINNKSAAGVEVGAMGGEGINRRVPAAQTKTDSEGYYHLEGLVAGNYQVTTFMPHLIAAEANQDYQFNSYYASAKGVLLAEGENVTDIDIKLARGGVITGRVTDAEDKPVVEERISLQLVTDPGGPRVNRLPPPIGQMYQTDDRGIYRIYGLPAGRYRVSAGRNGAQFVGSLSGSYQLTYHPDVTDPGRATIIDLTEGGEAKNVDIRLGRHEDTFDIGGRVVDAETGLPIAGVRLGVLMPQGSISLGTGMQTAADGKFAVSGVTRGHYGIHVPSDSGESDFYSDPVFVDVIDKDVSDVEVRAIRGITITGSIVGENIELKELLKQVSSLRVSASVLPADGRMTASTIRSFGSGAVAADGSFVVTGLRPGRAMLSVMSPDPSKRPSVVKISAGGVGVTQGFEIERGQPVSGVQILVAYGTGIIRGSVTFQGAPLANYRTEIICRREASRTFAGGASLDARGHFVLRQLAPGVYDCGLQYINIAGGPVPRPPETQHQSVTVSNGTESELNFVVDLTPKGVGP